MGNSDQSPAYLTGISDFFKKQPAKSPHLRYMTKSELAEYRAGQRYARKQL